MFRKSAAAWLNSAEALGDDALWDIGASACDWLQARHLDSLYLSPQTHIHFWSDPTMVYVEWDNREMRIDGHPAWSATVGRHELTRDAFFSEVHSFHARLMEQMGDRVEQAFAGAIPADIRIDLPGLASEHIQRCGSLEAALSAPRTPTDWESALGAIRRVERGI